MGSTAGPARSEWECPVPLMDLTKAEFLPAASLPGAVIRNAPVSQPEALYVSSILPHSWHCRPQQKALLPWWRMILQYTCLWSERCRLLEADAVWDLLRRGAASPAPAVGAAPCKDAFCRGSSQVSFPSVPEIEQDLPHGRGFQ